MIDISNQRFGKLVAIKVTDKRDRFKRRIWECKCDCGKITEIVQHNLRSGNSMSCGCEKYLGKSFRSNVGKKYNRLLVIDRVFLKKGITYYKCLCDCGNECIVSNAHLISNHTKSCGCFKIEVCTKTLKDLRKKIKYSGNTHPRWKPELSDKERQKARGNEFKIWSRYILKRDDYTCQKCFKSNCKLNAHHLESWSINKKMRFNKLNGITLCLECHKDIHSKYGFKVSVENSLDFLGFPVDSEYFIGIE